MKIHPLLLASFLIGSLLTAQDKPNIVFILADDMGYGDVASYGCMDIETTNLDRLAASGVRFTSGYSSHPYCSPMRAALMAGRYQHRFGYERNIAYDQHNMVMGLPKTEKTVAARMQEAGYKTGAVGKWHLGAWKLAKARDQAGIQLFNVEKDIGETNNLVSTNPEILGRLIKLYEDWNSKNIPPFFPGYREYHVLLDEFYNSISAPSEK